MSTEKRVASFTYTDQELLDLWRECDARISMNQSYKMADGREFTLADAAQVRLNIAYYEAKVNAAAGGPDRILVRMAGR